VAALRESGASARLFREFPAVSASLINACDRFAAFHSPVFTLVCNGASYCLRRGIWALGDRNGKEAFTHTAYNDFEIVAANLLDRDSRRVSERITAYALYIDPALGRVGMTLAQARTSGRRVLAGERPMTRVARAVEKRARRKDLCASSSMATQRDPWRLIARYRMRPGCPRNPRFYVCQSPYTVMQHARHIIRRSASCYRRS
jgi:hypothetical protein